MLISTGTKNLQEQIFFKDIPALRDALGIPFTATYMKGRANYLCLHRLDQLNEGAGPAVHDVFLPMIREWSGRTETGDRAELEDLPEDLPFWSEVSATAETCLGTECPRYDECFVTRMRQRAAASDLVIVNHHLLCADAAVRQNAFGEVIPACNNAILDEAHQLEDVATQYFGHSVSNYRVEDLARDVERFAASGPSAIGRADRDRDEIAKRPSRLRDRARTFFDDLAAAHQTGGSPRARSGSASRPRRSPRPAMRLPTSPAPWISRSHAGAASRQEGGDDAGGRSARLRIQRGRRSGLARAPGGRTAPRHPLSAPRDRRRVRVLRRVPRARRVSARVADRRVGHHPRAAAGSDARRRS